MSDRVLNQDGVRDLPIAGATTEREGAYSETVSDTQNLQVDCDTAESSCSDRSVLVEEVPDITQELN